MIKIQQLKDNHGLAVIRNAQHMAEVNAGWTAIEVSKILVAQHHRAVEAVNNYMSRIQDRSSSDLVACISDRD